MGNFVLQLKAFQDATKEKADLIVRKVAIDMLTRVVQKSPVGNPELWAANAAAAYGRETHNLYVDRINTQVDRDNAALDALYPEGDAPAPRQSRARRAGRRRLEKLYPLKVGKGYIGGRFRGNWQVTIAAPATGTLPTVDPSGKQATAAAVAALANFEAGPSIYLINNLPYGPRLEYEAWSKQAPAGMVRITVAEFEQVVSAAALR